MWTILTRKVKPVADSVRLNVSNDVLHVGQLRITGVGGASVVLIGDTKILCSSSIYDTPPESVIVGPLIPFASGAMNE